MFTYHAIFGAKTNSKIKYGAFVHFCHKDRGFVLGGFVLGGFVLGGFVLEGFCPYTKSNTNCQFILQKKIVRIVYGANFIDHTDVSFKGKRIGGVESYQHTR